MLTKSEEYRENARKCGELADEAKAWVALAEEQDWLDGRLPPPN
ncbi:hypothetical protein GGQ85_002317 [Nitrobacter vulgaris]|nr:hypothetical protein [Nitrobacter vulgaris]